MSDKDKGFASIGQGKSVINCRMTICEVIQFYFREYSFMKIALLLLFITSLSSCGILSQQGKKNSSSTETTTTQTIGQTAEDLHISAGIHIDLYCLDLYKPIDVKVKNGIVYYTGTVPSLKESFAASGVAWKQNGVKKVVNNLKVEKKSSKKPK